MTRRQTLQPLALGILALFCFHAPARPVFMTSEIEGRGSGPIFCDLDGDHLKDAVFLNGTNASVFFQDVKLGFSRKPQQEFHLTSQPALVCPANLGRKADSLLLMTSDGVTELRFTNQTDPPAREQIIRQPTIVPQTLPAYTSQAMPFPFTARTGAEWPLLLVPVAGGLQVWQHGDSNSWRQAQFIKQTVDTTILPSVEDPGYSASVGLDLCLDDVNGDGRDELMVTRYLPDRRDVYTLYLQNTNGLFNLEPALNYTNKSNWRTGLYWYDLNRDGKLDLIKSAFSDEPSFVPGLQSSKVLVAIYLADEHGQIPDAPQQVFRKSDWSGPLPMMDVDGDGFMDLVLGYIPIDSRESLRNMITAGVIDLNLKFHFYRPGAGYPKDPDYQRNVSVHFDRDMIWTMEDRLYHEKLISLDGDFNGDGKKDLLVRDHNDSISAYFFISRAAGFSPRADLKFSCPEAIQSWQVTDLNGDGVSDLVVKLRDQDVCRIFLSQGK